MNDQIISKRATVHDVAREAGVSLATVDRVLNGRPGVRPATIEKVEEAIARLDFSRDLSASLLARARDIRVHFLFPDGTNQFMANLAAALDRQARPAATERLMATQQRVHALDGRALADALDGLDPTSCDCAVVVATDTDEVRAAVDRAARRGIAVITLVSDLAGSVRRSFVGIDNVAAGRTAASLMGRFRHAGQIGLVMGSRELDDHRQRLDGFRAVARKEFPELELVGPVEGFDRTQTTKAAVARLLDTHPHLVGLYSMGAGNSGMLEALEHSGRAKSLSVIAHELTEATRQGLKSGAIDVVLDQNPEGEIRTALWLARQIALGRTQGLKSEPIEIGIFLRDNLR